MDAEGVDHTVVGRVGRPHGVRGDVAVEVRTDEPARRFAPGSTLLSDHATRPELVVERHRWHSGRLLVHFRDVEDRSAAEQLRGATLSVVLDPDETPDDPDEFYDRQLVGLAVVGLDGVQLGEVVAVQHGAQDLLVVSRTGESSAESTTESNAGTGNEPPETLIPFVKALVPHIELAKGQIVVDLPEGLLDLGPGPRTAADR